MEIKEAVLLRFKVLDSSIVVSLPGIITEIGKTERSTRELNMRSKTVFDCFTLCGVMYKNIFKILIYSCNQDLRTVSCHW